MDARLAVFPARTSKQALWGYFKLIVLIKEEHCIFSGNHQVSFLYYSSKSLTAEMFATCSEVTLKYHPLQLFL